MFGRKKSEETKGGGSSSKNYGLNAFLGKGTTFTGRLEFKGTAQISGTFNGDIVSEGILLIGEQGAITGKITVNDVKSSGAIHGDVQAKHKVTLHKTSRMEGNLQTQFLEIEEGAQFQGDVHMKKPAPDAK